jgi:chromate reductase
MPQKQARIRILGLAGSLREDSYNRALLEEAARLAPEGVTIEVFDRLDEIPPFNEDVEREGYPEPVRALQRAIEEANALLVATPEYNYSVPGVLKNAIDWASRPAGQSPLEGKPTAVMGASPGMGGTARAQLALRDSFVFTKTPVVPGPEVLVARAPERFDEEGRLTDEPTREFVTDLLDRLVDYAQRFKDNHDS